MKFISLIALTLVISSVLSLQLTYSKSASLEPEKKELTIKERTKMRLNKAKEKIQKDKAEENKDNDLLLQLEKVCKVDLDILKCYEDKIMSFAETINNEEKYNNFEKVFKKECNSLKDEKEKADCNAKANKGTIEKEFTDLKGKKGKLSYLYYLGVLQFGLEGKLVNFPKEDMSEVKDGLLNFITKHSAKKNEQLVDLTGADKISPQYTKLFSNLNKFTQIPRELLLNNHSIDTKDKLFEYISKEMFKELQKLLKAEMTGTQEQLLTELKKPDPNSSLFKDNASLKAIFAKVEAKKGIHFEL